MHIASSIVINKISLNKLMKTLNNNVQASKTGDSSNSAQEKTKKRCSLDK